MKRAVFIFIGFVLFSACRYGQPILAVPGERDSFAIDSLGHKSHSQEWYFICMRTGLHIGSFINSKTYDKHNRLIEKDKEKTTWQGCCDLPAKFYMKEIYYDSLGRKDSVRYFAQQNGWADYPLSDNTVYYKHK
jgi:hypothetical protein